MLIFYKLIRKSKVYISFAFILLFINSCRDKDSVETSNELAIGPAVTTTSVNLINSFSVMASGNVVSDGGSDVTGRGICYSTNAIMFNSCVSSGAGVGSFSATITGLSKDSTYYFRAYATNVAGTSYGDIQRLKTALVLGQPYEGGIIFNLDNTGQHGLIAALSDQGASASWGCTGDSITGPSGNGMQNTDSITSQCTTSGIAASLCKNLTSGGYNDWYLPAYTELNYLYIHRSEVGGFTTGFYWSSSQYNANNAYYQNFSTGSQGPASKSTTVNVRAIRAF